MLGRSHWRKLLPRILRHLASSGIHGVKGRLLASAPCLTNSLIEEHFDDVCVTGADGANAACSEHVLQLWPLPLLVFPTQKSN